MANGHSKYEKFKPKEFTEKPCFVRTTDSTYGKEINLCGRCQNPTFSTFINVLEPEVTYYCHLCVEVVRKEFENAN